VSHVFTTETDAEQRKATFSRNMDQFLIW
jgi:hypothetical protein